MIRYKLSIWGRHTTEVELRSSRCILLCLQFVTLLVMWSLIIWLRWCLSCFFTVKPLCLISSLWGDTLIPCNCTVSHQTFSLFIITFLYLWRYLHSYFIQRVIIHYYHLFWWSNHTVFGQSEPLQLASMSFWHVPSFFEHIATFWFSALGVYFSQSILMDRIR